MTPPPNTIAILAGHWLGDTFWATQTIPALKRHFPQARIIVYTKPWSRDLWAGLIQDDNLRAAPWLTSDRRREKTDFPEWLRQTLAARRERFDGILDFMGNRYSGSFARIARPAAAYGFNGFRMASCFYSRMAVIPAGEHLSRRPFRVLELLVGQDEYQRPRPVCRPACSFAEAAAQVGLDPAHPPVVIAPTAGWPAKEWPLACFRELAGRLAAAGTPILLLGAAADAERLESVAAGAAPGLARTAAGLPLGRVLALLSGCAAFVGNDSGPGHLAAAYGRPTNILFTGTTDPAICAPLGQDVHIWDTRARETSPETIAAALR
ncbi:MAG: glycosyltransferase family 9 protein [Lentisphaeria bacterium]|jgi:ADP-heptose:LPS heptosyltransferase